MPLYSQCSAMLQHYRRPREPHLSTARSAILSNVVHFGSYDTYMGRSCLLQVSSALTILIHDQIQIDDPSTPRKIGANTADASAGLHLLIYLACLIYQRLSSRTLALLPPPSYRESDLAGDCSSMLLYPRIWQECAWLNGQVSPRIRIAIDRPSSAHGEV